MEESLTNLDIAELCTLLPHGLASGTALAVFGLDEEKEAAFRRWADECGLVCTEGRGYSLDSRKVRIRSMERLLGVLPIILFRYLKTLPPKALPGAAEDVCRRLQIFKVGGLEITLLLTRIGDLFVQEGLMERGAVLFQLGAECCKQFALPKSSLVDCVLKLSRADFMRGSNPIETAQLQFAAMDMVTDQNMTPEDALLMLYAGVVQHFMGNEKEGHLLRERGLQTLEHSCSAAVQAEAMPLIGWHIYLQGDFRKTIEYYEDMILSIENSRQAELSTLTYPPIIYSYMFLGEFQRAMILAEIIYNSALEHEDYSTAILTHCIEGRIHVSAGNNESGAEILYKSLAEGVQKEFVWGQYYTLCALCQFHLNSGQMDACHDDVLQMRALANRHHIGRMYSSPFMLDVLRDLKRAGFPPVPSMEYERELRRHMDSFNIHMKGVSCRHLALLEKSRGGAQETILDLLRESVELLSRSGNFLELGLSYAELARIMSELGSTSDARRYATLSFKTFGTHTREYFPCELFSFVEIGGLSLDIGIDLYTLQLELRYIFEREKLTLRLLTKLSRILKVESAGFAEIQNGKPVVTAVQNIGRQSCSAQHQRMLGWMSYTAGTGKQVHRFSPENGSCSLLVDFQREPRFILCLPFPGQEDVKAVLYLESYYRPEALSRSEREHLDKFLASISGHMLGVLNFRHEEAAWQALPGRREPSSGRPGADFCTGITDAMKTVLHHISLIAKTELPVLFTGETGVGKEVYARELYHQSGRTGPLVVINCGAIPDTLMESEMFGYERGSFTGAIQTHKGYFESANGGTVFLDEIGELSLSAQVKLLRVLQEKEIMRIGGHETIKTDFRLIAATNQDLQKLTEQGLFRSDLYFRLSVLPIEIPPLRGRRADIPVIVRFLTEKHCTLMGMPICEIDADTMALLMEYEWPGNVRELENVIQRGILLAQDGKLVLENLEGRGPGPAEDNEPILPLQEMERRYIRKVLRHCGGRISGEGGAAELLGLKRTTLISRMERLGINQKV